MSLDEQILHEALKLLLKAAIQSNPKLSDYEKQTTMNSIDRRAMRADWIVEIARQLGWLE